MRIAVLGLVLSIGCGGASKRSQAPATDTCSKEWDLGTGSASDIERLAPDFAGTESKLRAVAGAELPPGMTVHRLANYGVEIRTGPIRKEKIRVLRPLRDRTSSWLMLVPGECHHLVAKQTCGTGHPKLTVAASGGSPCVAGQSIRASRGSRSLPTFGVGSSGLVLSTHHPFPRSGRPGSASRRKK